jgi:periplasmic protein TonB
LTAPRGVEQRRPVATPTPLTWRGVRISKFALCVHRGPRSGVSPPPSRSMLRRSFIWRLALDHLFRIQRAHIVCSTLKIPFSILNYCCCVPSSGRGAPVTWFTRPGDSDYEEDENGVLFHNRPRPPYLPTLSQNERVSGPTLTDKTLGDHKRSSIIGWGAATAGAFCIGIVLLSSFPGEDRQSSTSKETPRVTADTTRVSGRGRSLGPNAAQPTNLNDVAASDPSEHATRAADTPAASNALGRPVKSASDERIKQDVRQVAARDNPVATRHANTSPRATPRDAKGASSAPVKTAAARPNAPVSAPALARAPRVAATPLPRRVPPGILGATVGARLVRSPARWIGGGPSDADNQRGRYRGTVGVQVTVNPAGYVSRCAPIRGSGNAGLDTMTCRLVVQRARFTPAFDGQGRPTASQVYTTFVWGRTRRR